MHQSVLLWQTLRLVQVYWNRNARFLSSEFPYFLAGIIIKKYDKVPTVFWSLSERTKSLTIMKKNIKYKLELTTGIHAYIDHEFCLVKLLLFWISCPAPPHLKLPIIYNTLWSVRNRIFSANWIAHADSIRSIFRLIGSSFVWLGKLGE